MIEPNEGSRKEILNTNESQARSKYFPTAQSMQ